MMTVYCSLPLKIGDLRDDLTLRRPTETQIIQAKIKDHRKQARQAFLLRLRRSVGRIFGVKP